MRFPGIRSRRGYRSRWAIDHSAWSSPCSPVTTGSELLDDEAKAAYERWGTPAGSSVKTASGATCRSHVGLQPVRPFHGSRSPHVAAWVASLDEEATPSTRSAWSGPSRESTFGGGSAFDAFVIYSAGSKRRFLGIECKYAEDLSKSSIGSICTFTYSEGRKQGQRPSSYLEYEKFTRQRDDLWDRAAATSLDRPRLRQFWLNTLLTQKTQEVAGFDRGLGLVMSHRRDEAAEHATDEVRSHCMTLIAGCGGNRTNA